MSRHNRREESSGIHKQTTEGTIQHDLDNLGRRLISVQWDIGTIDYVFPSEIEILDDKAAELSTL